MTSQDRIAAFYSRGPHFTRNLKRLRARYPGAHITAIVPPGYPEEPLAGLADAVERTGRSHYGPRDVAALRRLAAQLRAPRYTCFAVMFDTPKLRLVAAASGARERLALTVDGRITPLRLGLAGAAAGALARSLRGRLTYARIWLVVHCTRIDTRP